MSEQKAQESEFIKNVEQQLERQTPGNTLSEYQGFSGVSPSAPRTTLQEFSQLPNMNSHTPSSTLQEYNGFSGIGNVPSTLSEYGEFLNSPDAFSLMK